MPIQAARIGKPSTFLSQRFRPVGSQAERRAPMMCSSAAVFTDSRAPSVAVAEIGAVSDIDAALRMWRRHPPWPAMRVTRIRLSRSRGRLAPHWRPTWVRAISFRAAPYGNLAACFLRVTVPRERGRRLWVTALRSDELAARQAESSLTPNERILTDPKSPKFAAISDLHALPRANH